MKKIYYLLPLCLLAILQTKTMDENFLQKDTLKDLKKRSLPQLTFARAMLSSDFDEKIKAADIILQIAHLIYLNSELLKKSTTPFGMLNNKCKILKEQFNKILDSTNCNQIPESLLERIFFVQNFMYESHLDNNITNLNYSSKKQCHSFINE